MHHSGNLVHFGFFRVSHPRLDLCAPRDEISTSGSRAFIELLPSTYWLTVPIAGVRVERLLDPHLLNVPLVHEVMRLIYCKTGTERSAIAAPRTSSLR
jgi:hypothetical protein